MYLGSVFLILLVPICLLANWNMSYTSSNSDPGIAIAFQQLSIIESGSVAEKSRKTPNAHVSAVKRPPHLRSKVSNKMCARFDDTCLAM